jgi:hypothetical protein
LLRIAPRSLAVTARTPVNGVPYGLDVISDAVVASVFSPESNRGDLWLFNPDTARVTQTVRLAGGAVGVADDRTAGTWSVAWSESEGGTVTRLEPTSSPPPHDVPIASFPTDIAIGAGAVWIAIGEPAF